MTIEWTNPATRDLRRLDRSTQQRIVQAVVNFAERRGGNVRKLRGSSAEWRLRVGDWRVRYTYTNQGQTLVVLRVLHRGRAY